MALGAITARLLALSYAALLAGGLLLPSGPDAPGGWDRSLTPTAQNAMHAPAYALLLVPSRQGKHGRAFKT